MANEVELNDWRLERLKWMTSPPSVVRDAVEEACLSPLATMTRITEGFSNEVYGVSTADGQQVIVRIHWSSPYFEEEQWALDQCASLNLPTPRFLLLRQEPAYSICVETHLPGQTLFALLTKGELTSISARPLLVAAGAHLAKLHSISTSGWGRINVQGVGQAIQWSDLLHPIIDDIYQAARNLHLTQHDVDEALQLIQEHILLFADISPRLLHGDFSPQHILVHEGQVSGFIDFEFPRSGDPAWEFAYWDYYTGQQPFRGPRIPTSWLLEGYQSVVPCDATFEQRVVVGRLELGLQLLAYHGIRDDQEPAFLAFLRQNFMQDLEKLRHFTGR